MLRTSSRALLLLLVTALAGCDDDSTGPPEILDEYFLQSINGEPPPQAIFENDNGTLFLTEGQLALAVNGRYIMQLNFEQQIAGGPAVESSRICEGDFTLDGSDLVLVEDECDDRTFEATLVGDILTFTFSEGVELTWVVLDVS